MLIKTSRREWLRSAAYGVGGFAVGGMMPGGGWLGVPQANAAATFVDPLAPKKPHFPAKVKSVIWLHMDGAPSTLDLYDYKPELQRLAGQDIPSSFLEGIKTSTQGGVGKLFVSNNRSWKQYGQSGAWFSDLLPNLAQQADKLTFVKSSVTVGATHDISILKLNTGDLSPGRPSLGAWVAYALGSGQSRSAALCRALWRHSASRVRARSIGAPASCRRSIREPLSVPARSRSCIRRRRS